MLEICYNYSMHPQAFDLEIRMYIFQLKNTHY